MKLKTQNDHHRQAVRSALETASSYLKRASMTFDKKDVEAGRRWLESALDLVDNPPDAIDLIVDERPNGLSDLSKV